MVSAEEEDVSSETSAEAMTVNNDTSSNVRDQHQPSVENEARLHESNVVDDTNHSNEEGAMRADANILSLDVVEDRSTGRESSALNKNHHGAVNDVQYNTNVADVESQEESSQEIEMDLEGEDLSSMGMGSIVSSPSGTTISTWEEGDLVPVTPFSTPYHLRSSHQRALRSWTPSSPDLGRSSRWEYLDGRLPRTRRLGEPARHTLPPVLPGQYNMTEQPRSASGDDDSVTREQKNPDVPAATENESNGTSSDDANFSNAIKESASKASSPCTNNPYTVLGAPGSKFATYSCLVDSTQGDRAVEINLASFSRPHMRAFHLAWMSFFVAFFTWFALTPLLDEISISLDLTKQEIWNSSICGVAGSAVTRILVGPVCDKYGARWPMGGTLFLSAIPMGLTGLVQTGTGLNILRLFIGLAGSAFVTSQYWTSSMFTPEVAGTANALVAGWGNMGGGVTQIVMGSLLFPLFKIIYGGEGWSRANAPSSGQTTDESDRSSELAWRTICVVPALFCLVMTYFVIQRADDCPKGNYSKRHRQRLMPSVSARRALLLGVKDFNTWILFIQYGCCFGVEITMVNAAALYFKEEFGQSTESAAAIASIFGWMNLFARGAGGFASDIFNAKLGMRGRLLVQLASLVMEGALAVAFSKTYTLGGAIVVMIFFSCFVQMSEGSTYGIVPYVNPTITGSVAGIVGAGGNVGGVAFATIFRQFYYRNAFSAMGWTAMISAVLTFFLFIRGHAALCCGSDAPEVMSRRTSHADRLRSTPHLDEADGNASSRPQALQ